MKCSIENCDGAVRCKGVCNKHYHVMKNARKMKACGCGCGEQTPNTFKWGHHTRLLSNEEQARRARHNDGSALRDRGTKDTYRKVGQRHEHRNVMEQKLGRPLQPGEIVHHVDEVKRNNAPDNLELTTRPDHIRHHLHRKHA